MKIFYSVEYRFVSELILINENISSILGYKVQIANYIHIADENMRRLDAALAFG